MDFGRILELLGRIWEDKQCSGQSLHQPIFSTNGLGDKSRQKPTLGHVVPDQFWDKSFQKQTPRQIVPNTSLQQIVPKTNTFHEQTAGQIVPRRILERVAVLGQKVPKTTYLELYATRHATYAVGYTLYHTNNLPKWSPNRLKNSIFGYFFAILFSTAFFYRFLEAPTLKNVALASTGARFSQN